MQKLQMRWGNMAYTDSGGDGIPLVLLHGTFCDAEDWGEMIAALPSGPQVVNLEFRGHGESDTPTEPFTMEDLADDVLALIAHLGLSRLILVGHSLGGMIAMLAAARSSRVAGLVLLEAWTNRQACEAYSGERTLGRLDARAVERINEKCDSYLGRFQPEVWKAFAESAATFDGYAYLKQATIPVQEVYGTFGRNEATEEQLRIPENSLIRIAWVEDAGHYLPHERPGEVARICVQAVADLADRCGQ